MGWNFYLRTNNTYDLNLKKKKRRRKDHVLKNTFIKDGIMHGVRGVTINHLINCDYCLVKK